MGCQPSLPLELFPTFLQHTGQNKTTWSDAVDDRTARCATRSCESSEGALLAAIAAGQQEALVALYQRYQRPLFVYLLRLLRDEGLAEEVLQDVIVALWQGAGSFAGRSRVSTWVFGIAHYQALQAARRRHLPLLSPEDCPEMTDEAQDAERVTFALALQEDLEAALERLSPLHREALELVLSQGFSYDEVALITAVPVGTVKSRVNQARRLMQQMLIQRGWREGVQR
jgi:RNA polymerase sigma-70 factor (ECF subfamily)